MISINKAGRAKVAIVDITLPCGPFNPVNSANTNLPSLVQVSKVVNKNVDKANIPKPAPKDSEIPKMLMMLQLQNR